MSHLPIRNQPDGSGRAAAKVRPRSANELVRRILRNGPPPILVMTAGVALLGCGPWMVRLAGITPLASAFWRLALAVPPLFLLCSLLGQPLRISPRALVTMALAGLFYGGGTVALNISALHTTLANCALIGNFSSFLLAGIGLAATRRMPPALVLIALLMAVTGIGLLLGSSVHFSPGSAQGDMIALIAALLYTGYFLAIGRLGAGIAPLSVHMMATAAGAAAIAPFALLGSLAPKQWWPVTMLVASQVVGQGMVVFAVPGLPRPVVGLCILIFPVVSAAIGWMAYGEILDGPQLIGGMLILLAIPLTQLRGR